jgi:hypothetical protein
MFLGFVSLFISSLFFFYLRVSAQDITPPAISTWLQQPIERAHVLLDRKGKTQSHAFVEVADEKIAGAILRGEVLGSATGGRRVMLGKGRRARGVTITRSSQQELMMAVSGPFSFFPINVSRRLTLSGLFSSSLNGAEPLTALSLPLLGWIMAVSSPLLSMA